MRLIKTDSANNGELFRLTIRLAPARIGNIPSWFILSIHMPRTPGHNSNHARYLSTATSKPSARGRGAISEL